MRKLFLLKTLSLLTILSLIIMCGNLANAEDEIVFWTTEVEKDRLSTQQNIAKGFTKKTGIAVRIIPVEENFLAARVTAAYAARSLPDVLYHPIDFTIGWTKAGILDSQSSTEVVTSLGKNTFSPGPLDLVRVKSGYAAVPLDAWGQLLLFRKDLFREKGLEAPDTWDRILKAAKALNNPPKMWGFEVATDPGQTYTQQVFEHLALSNGVRLAGRTGDPNQEINLNTPEMVATLRFYKALSRFTPPGNINWLHTRIDYLSGRAAMIIWSPFILDELSGLRNDQPVLPDIIKKDPGFLARNTGFVTVIQGPNGSAQYGQINCIGITLDAARAPAKQWVEFLLGEGYLRWLSMAAEGKLPVRKGTKVRPECFINGWMDLDFGVTTRAKISRFYGLSVAKSMTAGVNGLDRWGLARGKGDLISKIYGTKIIPEILKRFLDGELNAKDAARLMDEKVRALEDR
ncbi:MAG TPA: extracellular solute-binding protein [Deltaproteobacteria bacterium]|nr:extracellular solute-binding protein [Deltaproteobacteria bacterium]